MSAIVLTSCARNESILPRMRESALARKQQCTEAGWRFYRVKESDAKARSVAISEPEFAYNVKLDTCICAYVESLSQQDQTFRTFDVLANRQLAFLQIVNDKPLVIEVDGVYLTPADHAGENRYFDRQAELLGTRADRKD